MPGRKEVKGFLLVGHEKVPHGFGLTEDHGGNTADGAGTEGLPEPRTSSSFPEPRTGQRGEGRTVSLWIF